MKKSRFPAFLLSFLIIIPFFLFWPTDKHPVNPYSSKQTQWEEVIAYAKRNLPQKGTLKRKSDGYVYLKVDDAYIYSLFPMLGLEQEKFRKPPYFRSPEAAGAHISIFNADEKINPKAELGNTFSFKLKEIVVVSTSKKDMFAIINVDAPDLERLREKYGLKSKLQGHEFHITLAKKTYRKGIDGSNYSRNRSKRHSRSNQTYKPIRL